MNANITHVERKIPPELSSAAVFERYRDRI